MRTLQFSSASGLLLQRTKPYYPATVREYEGWNFNSGNYLFTTDTK